MTPPPAVRLNGGYVHRSTVGPLDRGRTLPDYLARRYPHAGSEGRWIQRIRRGELRVAGRVAVETLELRGGAVVEWQRPPWAEPWAPRSFAVLHEDGDLLAVAKPAGLPTLPGAGFLDNTLWAVVRERYPRATPAHRLGRWTSGIVLLALTDAARRELSEAFRARRVLKRYRALASGRPDRRCFQVACPIGPVPYPRLGTLHAAAGDGRPALSRVRVLHRFEDRFLARVSIRTGRPHQIRIHLAAAGYPLIGDPLYRSGGVPHAEGRALPGDPGYRLHAEELAVTLFGRKRVRITCAPPPVLRLPRECSASGLDRLVEARRVALEQPPPQNKQ